MLIYIADIYTHCCVYITGAIVRWHLSNHLERMAFFPIFLQKGIQYLDYPLQCIYRASLLVGYVPISWRVAKVAFIPNLGD